MREQKDNKHSVRVLESTYKKMRETPLKVYVLRDFSSTNLYVKKSLLALIRMDLVEIVKCKYNNNHGGYRLVDGYKLKEVKFK